VYAVWIESIARIVGRSACVCAGHPDDRDDRLRPREDRGVTRRAAVARDEGEHLVELQQRRIGGREVGGDEDERGVAGGHARRGHAAQVGDDALADVGEVGRPLGHVPAHGGQLVLERGERLEHGALPRRTGVDARLDVVGERGVLGHHGCRLQHRLRLTARLGALRCQLLGHGGEGLLHLGVLRGRVASVRPGDRLGQRIGHSQNRADRDPAPDPNTVQLHRCQGPLEN